MMSLEKAYGEDAARVREIYARIASGDVAFLREELAALPYLLEPPDFNLAAYPGVLHYAVEHNQLAVCQLLVELGADVNQITAGSGNATPLGLAARNGQLEIIRWLLKVGADVDGSPESITSPLIAAVTFGTHDVVELLLAHHADINRLHAKFNRTALDLARSWGFNEIAKRLEAEGGISAMNADPNEGLAPGAPIVEFVTETVGWVLPEKLSPEMEELDVKLRVSCIANKNDLKLIFTVGLFEKLPRTELLMCLPGSWRLPRQGLDINSAWAFPQRVLAALSKRALENIPLTEGEIILRSDPAYSSLSWPRDTHALIVVDKVWAATDEHTARNHDDSVKLYLLAPLKLTKNGPPQGEALEKALQKKHTASWKSVALPSPVENGAIISMSKYILALELNLTTRPMQVRSLREACVLYVYLLTTKCKFRTGGVAKVVLQPAPFEAELTVGDICTYFYPFKKLQACPANAQPPTLNRCLIEDIHEALLSLAVLKGWDVAPLHNLHAEIVKRGYSFSGTSGRSVKNPSKTLSAAMAWRTNDYIDIGVLVKEGLSDTFIAVSSIGISLGLSELLLGSIVWVDDQTLRLFQGNQRDYWEIDTKSKLVKFHFARAEAGDGHGQFDLAKMYINGWIVEQDMENARYWLERSAAQGYTLATKLLQRISEGHESFESLADPIMNSRK